MVLGILKDLVPVLLGAGILSGPVILPLLRFLPVTTVLAVLSGGGAVGLGAGKGGGFGGPPIHIISSPKL
tara:strand:- start:381 stop:590 length:210 start_codon:yes stop_codon:yes gene_type:complete